MASQRKLDAPLLQKKPTRKQPVHFEDPLENSGIKVPGTAEGTDLGKARHRRTS